MTSTTSIHIVLLKKELRQFAPLIVGIVFLAMFGFVVIESQPQSWRVNAISTGYLLLAIPALFAVGAGAISVSQEKETRTLGWLTSLPLTRERLIRTKFASAVLILVLLWLLTIGSVLLFDLFGFGNPFPGESPETHPIYTSRLAFWAMNTFYLLVCSFLTAWWFGSSMTSLVAFVPLALAPSALRLAIAYVQNPGHHLGSSTYDATQTQLVASITISIAFAFWFMRKFAYRALQPAETKAPRNPYASVPSAVALNKQSSQSVLDPTTAMLWQFVFQNKTVLLSILAASGICGLVIMIVMSPTYSRPSSQVEPVAWLVIGLCVSWKGVLAFQGDNLQERIRFLSDRGVRPFNVWLTRLLIPFSFAASVSLFYAVYRSRLEAMLPDQTNAPVWTIFLYTMIAIGYSQWLSQLVRNPILGAIGAPLISSAAGTYLAYSYGFLGASTWSLVLICIVPYVATIWTMARWMDRRFDLNFWCSQGVFALALLIPVIELGWYVFRFPNMPRSVQISMREEAKSLGAFDAFAANKTQPQSYVLESLIGTSLSIYGGGDLTVDQKLKLANEMDDSQTLLSELNRVVATQHSTTGIWFQDLSNITARVSLARIAAIDSNGKKPQIHDYQNELELLFEILKSLRSNRHLLSQEVADMHEIVLLRELLQPTARNHIEPLNFEKYVAFVSDSVARNRARREALVVSWARFDASVTENTASDWLPYWYRGEPQARKMLTIRSQVNHLAWVLIQFLEAGPTATEDQKIEFLKARFTETEWSSFHQWYRAGRVDSPLQVQSFIGQRQFLGDQWFAGWEQIARELGNTSE